MAGKVILDTDILSEYLKGYDVNVVARGNRYALVTGNTGHFQAIQGTGVGLVIENWRKP